MVNFSVEYKDDEIIFSDDGKPIIGSRSSNEDDFTKFKEWIHTYNNALELHDKKELLLTIGREIYEWLNGKQNTLEKVLENANPPLIIEFQIPANSSDIQKAFIEAPWELLADKTGHLAKNTTWIYSPVRRIAEKKTKRKPSEYRLNTVFMAASPGDVMPVLSYEQEESAILNLHTDNALEMDLFVEESGNLEQLILFVDEKKPVDVVHISCHGDNLDDKNNKTCLCLEDSTGKLETVTPDLFCRQFTQNRPALTFLSACKTAEAHPNDEALKEEKFSTFTQEIVERGFPAVLGWSGSVIDFEATRFASCFYRELTLSSSVEEAVAHSRSLLFVPPEKHEGEYESRDWHLARLYLGPDGGGILSNGRDIRFDYAKKIGKDFLGKKEKGLEVAGRNEFVGRRREIQSILKELRDNMHAGILIHGPGNQGKSSLAARIVNRMQDHNYEIVLVYGKKNEERHYSAWHILNEFKPVSGIETEKRIDELLKEVTKNEIYLKASLKELLEGPFSGKDNEHKPVLLVIDDLEKILTEPDSDSGLFAARKAYRPALISVIKAFEEAGTKSRLLLTSRYDFDLIDDLDDNIAGKLLKLPLPSMNDIEAKKQYFAKYGTLDKEKDQVILEPDRVVKACRGNPGLQDMMFGLFTDNPKSYVEALKQMEAYLEGSDLPEEENVQKFLQDLALDTIFSLLSCGEKELLRLATLFDIPAPDAVFDAVKEALINKGVDYKKRFVGFGLFECYENFVVSGRNSMLINSIVKSAIGNPSQDSVDAAAGSVTDALMANWCEDEVAYRPYVCDREIVKFGLISKNTEAIIVCGENCIRGLDNNFHSIEAADKAVRSISMLEEKKVTAPAGLYQIASKVCHGTGEVELAGEYIKKSLEIIEDDSVEAALSYMQLGRILEQKGEVDSAVGHFEKAGALFVTLEMDRESAIALGDIARIKKSKGDVDEALELHEEELNVYDKLGDTRSKAVTLGDIARIKADKGDVDEALKLHEERIQVFDKLGDTRSKAVTLGYIARIKKSKGDVDEALKLHEEVLNVYDKLGDISSRAVTLWDISKILLQKEEFQEAYKHLAESYQINLNLGRLDGICYVGVDLGMLLIQSNHKEEGLQILNRSKEGFEKMGQKANSLQIQEIINQFK